MVSSNPTKKEGKKGNIRKTRGILPSCGHELGVLGSNEDDYSLL
jgi:hypothetical protein